MRDAIYSEVAQRKYDPKTIGSRFCLNEQHLKRTEWTRSCTLGNDNVAQILANEGHAIHECVAGIATGRTASLIASEIHDGIKSACTERHVRRSRLWDEYDGDPVCLIRTAIMCSIVLRVNRLMDRQDFLYTFGHMVGNMVEFYEQPGLLDAMAHCEETCTCTQALELITFYLEIDEASVIAPTMPSFVTGNELSLAWRSARGLNPSAASNRDVAVAFVAAGASGIDTTEDDEDALVAILVAKHLRDGTSDLVSCASCCDDIMSENNPHRKNINAMLYLDPADMSKEGLMVRAGMNIYTDIMHLSSTDATYMLHVLWQIEGSIAHSSKTSQKVVNADRRDSIFSTPTSPGSKWAERTMGFATPAYYVIKNILYGPKAH
ncbi:hypothetical protein BGZ83_008613 [Gryganskiella cystojenkinii]|nr:hypothetical protein BGZ83_008613 [Gryganskiella cystojenkinii]